MNEKLIEKKLRMAVSKRGGLALKLTSPFFTGLPDRLVLMPVRRVWFVETKSTGDKLSPRQRFVRKLLEKLGFPVWVVDTQEKLDEFLTEVDA